jgi:hypothetical protein
MFGRKYEPSLLLKQVNSRGFQLNESIPLTEIISMRKVFLMLILAPVVCQSQTISGDTLIVDSATKLVKGSFIEIGAGSKSDGSYAFIYVAPKNQKETKAFVAANHYTIVFLSPGWTGNKMKVIDFKLVGDLTTGRKYYLILSAGTNTNYTCDPQLALNVKEIFKK